MFFIIKPLQSWLRNNQRFTFHSWDICHQHWAYVTFKFPKHLSLMLIFCLYLLSPSAPWVIWASPRTGVRVESSFNAIPTSPRLELNTGKCCETVGLSGGDVSPFRQNRTETGHEHTVCIATCTNRFFRMLATSRSFLPTDKSLIKAMTKMMFLSVLEWEKNNRKRRRNRHEGNK